jgi:hypothetical protein
LASPALTLKLDENLTAFWRTRHFQEQKISNFNHNTLLAFAYRPACSDQLNLIGKGQLDWIRQLNTENELEEKTWSASFDIHYRPLESFDVMGRYALKYVQSEYIGGTAETFTDLVAARVLYELDQSFDIGIHGGILHEYKSEQFTYAYGVEVGYKIVKNLWLSAGYNIKGLEDDKMVGNDFLREGFYITVRFKFDEETAEDLANAW